MATLGTLVSRIETRLALAAGIDVQIIEEPRMVEMLRHKYNTVFDEVWWPDNLTLEEFTTDGSTGLITGTVENKIRRFIDIHSIFYSLDPDPLPLIQFGSNPLLRNRPGFAPYTSDAEKMFKVYPIDVEATLQVWYRTRMSDDDWEDGDDEIEVNFDDELLILGVVADYLVDDGSNDASAERYTQMYDKRFQQLIKSQFQAPIQKVSARSSYPTEWEDGP